MIRGAAGAEPRDWQREANEKLAWIGREVVIFENGDARRGLFEGVDEKGEALLDMGGSRRSFYSGSMRLAPGS